MRLRSPVPSDAPAVLEVIVARDRVDLGYPDFTLEDLREEWGYSGFDLAADAVVCETSDRAIVAYAAVRRAGSLAVVSPDHEGRGIGRRLLEWVHERERAHGRVRHRQAIASTNARAMQLLRGAGYSLFVSYSRMACELARAGQDAVMPAGVRLRMPDRGRDAQDIYTSDAEAFASSPDYLPMTFTAFRQEHLDAHDHAAELSLVAERDGELAGFLLARRFEQESVGYVDILAVRPGHQREGIGTALLQTALARFAAVGLREAQLGVASTNPGALRLYERVGMTPRFRVDVYERLLAGSAAAVDRGEALKAAELE